MHIRHITIIALLALSSLAANAQTRRHDYVVYIKEYHEIAIDHQRRYKIPASITLAQGLLESGAGKSRLATEANNHFGIKCHDWTGKKIYQADDGPNDCFRKYSHVKDSYNDHSLFLTGRPRYASLFKLSSTDYRGWAKGLQQCGYATDRAYANKLIKIIEDYELYQYDKKGLVRTVDVAVSKRGELPSWYKTHQVYQTNDLLYVVARDGDTFELIGAELGFKPKKLARYNEVPTDYPLSKGDVVFLEKKKRKAAKGDTFHTVQVGESMHSISQLYGIRMGNLYKMNHKDDDYLPEEGDLLRLR
jgi:LysM repeat protein